MITTGAGFFLATSCADPDAVPRALFSACFAADATALPAFSTAALLLDPFDDEDDLLDDLLDPAELAAAVPAADTADARLSTDEDSWLTADVKLSTEDCSPSMPAAVVVASWSVASTVAVAAAVTAVPTTLAV
ncbi:hypothetical protein Mco01_77290 [Microbispora corallina]|uniref:Secreted protein n=1 Tax=Microbispora corallina TaxID=83302 RepID=A0ABQ4GCE1_9ACTN|nr:hypothetical protein Mco01_77290 [Microbispora corallina]